MSNLQPSSVKFFVIAFLVVVASGSLIALMWPTAITIAHQQAGQLVAEGALTNGGEAEADYHLATLLEPGNTAAHLGLAEQQYSTGQFAAALASQVGAGDTVSSQQIKVEALLQLTRNHDAATAADNLLTVCSTDDCLKLGAFAYDLDGRASDATSLEARVSSPEAARSITLAQAGQIPLAAQLYASGLLNSSSALLLSLPESFERDLMLGQIYATSVQKADLLRAARYLQASTSLQPSNLQAHQLLASVYRSLNQFSNAGQQDQLVSNLLTGRP
jgi:hypothetical protein